ncbi:MAG: hypothetical protein AVO38_12710 [delta proteobacterium ML8_D]|nr:MAG: hypothetical protein AVO38_12710 [delta proteobacterium ML8_D]
MKHPALKLILCVFICAFFTVPALADITIMEPGFRAVVLNSGLSNPQDITISYPGGVYGANLFVTEYDTDTVSRISPAGVKSVLSTGVTYPVAILFGRGAFGHHLYVSESYSTDGNIVRVAPNGAKTGFASGIDSPLDMVWGPGGAFGSDLYVASANANKIVTVSAAGAVSDFLTGLDRPSVLAFSQGGAFGEYLYVTNTDDGQVVRIDQNKKVEVFVTGLPRPIGLAFGYNTPFGDFLYISDKNTGEILKISPSGTVSTFADGFDGPVEIHFSEGGLYGNDMLIAEGGSGRITRIVSLGAPTIVITPFSGDVEQGPFTLAFTVSDPQGLSNLTDFHFLYNGIDITAASVNYLITSIASMDENSVRFSLPGIALPSGTHTIEIIASDAEGHTGHGKVTYSIQ